jgi:hypothetical protein
MPTADRTTIRAAIEALTSSFRANLAADPPTATKPFRRILIGAAGADAFARPHLTLAMTRARTLAGVDDDHVVEVTLTLHVVTDVTADDAHGDVLDQIGAIEDHLDGLADAGVIEGAEGPSARVWSFDYPRATSGARVIAASATQAMIVKVERSQNRVPA